MIDALTDEQCMIATQTGSVEACTVLVRRYHAPLLDYLSRLLGEKQGIAEDLVQETFVRVFQRGGYQSGRPFRPWLYAIATNLARNHWKAASTRSQVAGANDAWLDIQDSAPGPEDVVLGREEGQRVAAAFAKLTEEYRVTLVLRFYHDLSLQEIAEALHVPLGTVKSRLFTGTRRLRELLQSAEGEEKKR